MRGAGSWKIMATASPPRKAVNPILRIANCLLVPNSFSLEVSLDIRNSVPANENAIARPRKNSCRKSTIDYLPRITADRPFAAVTLAKYCPLEVSYCEVFEVPRKYSEANLFTEGDPSNTRGVVIDADGVIQD